MSDKTNQNQNNIKKARLGRGLGSLLSGAVAEAPSEVPKAAVEAPVMESAPSVAVANTTESTPLVRPLPTSVVNQSSAAPAATSVQTPAVAHPIPELTQVTSQPAAPPAKQTINEESQIWMIPVDRLAPNTQQPRQIFTPEGLRDLSASIKEKGVLQPIVARRLGEREFEIIAGERRWRAAQAAGLHEVPVILKKVDEQNSLELAIIENIQRENLNSMEEAEAYDRLMADYSLTQQQVADKLGKERSSVANTLRLLTLPAELKDLVKRNQLSAGHAKVLLGLDNQQTQISIGRQVVNEKLSVRATEKLVAKAKTEQRNPSQAKSFDVNVSQRLIDGLSAELQKLIGTKVAIDYADSKGKLAIHFYSDDQLTHIVEKLRKAWEK